MTLSDYQHSLIDGIDEKLCPDNKTRIVKKERSGSDGTVKAEIHTDTKKIRMPLNLQKHHNPVIETTIYGAVIEFTHNTVHYRIKVLTNKL